MLLLPQEGFEDATHYLVVRGAAEAMGDNPDVNYTLVPGLVPLVSKEIGEIEYVVAHLPEVAERLDSMTPSEALVGLAVAVGIFDSASLSKQPMVLRGVFLVAAALTHICGDPLPVRNTKTFRWKQTYDRCQAAGMKDPHGGVGDTWRNVGERFARRDDPVRVDDCLVHLRTDLLLLLLWRLDWTPLGATR